MAKFLLLIILFLHATATQEQSNGDIITLIKRLSAKIDRVEDQVKVLPQMESEMNSLKNKVQQLESATVKIDHNNKIPHSVLPAGFSHVRVADLQIEALHMAAAAACRGSTSSGGTGPWGNAIYPRSTGLSCAQVCANTSFENCGAEMSLQGRSDLARSSKDIVGYFYNYGCGDRSSNPAFETNIKEGDEINFDGYAYMSFCCCRH